MAYSTLYKDRYVLVIDGQRKTSYPDLATARLEADRLQLAYPRVTVGVQDQEVRDIQGEDEAHPDDASPQD